jgi:hypothetical protein
MMKKNPNSLKKAPGRDALHKSVVSLRHRTGIVKQNHPCPAEGDRGRPSVHTPAAPKEGLISFMSCGRDRQVGPYSGKPEVGYLIGFNLHRDQAALAQKTHVHPFAAGEGRTGPLEVGYENS